MKTILSLRNIIKKNWLTLEGLILTTLILSYLIFFAVDAIKKTFQLPISFEFFLIIEISILSLHFFVWFLAKFYKSLMPVRKKKINVGICIEHKDKQSGEFYAKTIDTFRRKLAEIDVNKEFNIFEIKNEKRFPNDKSAEKFILKEGINLLIWGHTEEGKVQGIDTTIFHIKFSYNFVSAGRTFEEHSNQRKNFAQNVDSALTGRLWKVTRPNTLPDLRVVSENLSEVSLYIIIKAIASYGLWRISLKYCDELLEMLRKYNNPNTFPRFAEFENMIKSEAADISNLIGYYYLVKENDFSKAKTFFKKSFKYINNFFPALINLAKVFWMEGNKVEAKRFTKLARNQKPNSALVRLNRAFFALEERKFKIAVNAYKKIKTIPEYSNVLIVTTFLFSVYEKTKDPAFLFGSGILNFRFGDEIIGKTELKHFLDLAGKLNDEYKPLVNYTLGILSSKKRS